HLIHWPNPRCDQYVEAWRAMIDARERGVVRQIGVSNFLPEHLERIESETGVRPVVNQIEIHPYFPQEDVLELHRERGILVEAWSPLGQGGEVLTEPVITNIAEGHGCTPAQVVLAWHLARGVIPIPRSSSPEHQRSNLAAADITLYGAEVEAITALGRSTGRMFDGDPAGQQEFRAGRALAAAGADESPRARFLWPGGSRLRPVGDALPWPTGAGCVAQGCASADLLAVQP